MRIHEFTVDKYDGEKIVIYGNSRSAYITTYCLNKLGLEVFCYATETGVYVAPFHNVITVASLARLCKEEKIIIIFSEFGMLQVSARILEKHGITDMYSARHLWKDVDFTQSGESQEYMESYYLGFNNFFFEDRLNNPDKVYVNSIDVVVSERCSLKCEHCSNLMQYYDNPKNLDIDDIKKSIDILLSKIDMLYEIRILGGEPFMNKDFVKLIDAYIDEPKVAKFAIYSNATIFPSEEVLSHLKNDKTYLTLSDYGELSRSLDKWIEWSRKEHVFCQVKPIELWQDLGKLERHDMDEYDLIDIYSNCECRNIPSLIKGRLYNCPYAANASNLGAMIKSEMDKDYLEITDALKKEDIEAFLNKRDYLEACRYCGGRNGKRARVKPAVQIKEPLIYIRMTDAVPKIADADQKSPGKTYDELLSVIVPVYNSEATVKKCLESILAQSYSNLEVIVVDDGSSDASLEIVKGIAHNDARVSIVANEHAGSVHTRNTGIAKACGSYISFVDSKDYLAPDYYENLMRAADGADIVLSRYMIELNEDYSVDSMMSYGQGRLRKCQIALEEGLYTDDTLNALVMNQFQYCRHEEEYDYSIWNKLFKSDFIKKIYHLTEDNGIDEEEYLLYTMCLLKSKSAKIVKEYGYFRSEERYKLFDKCLADKTLRGRMDEYFRLKNYVMENYDGDRNAVLKYLEEFCMQMISDVSKKLADDRFTYYPYYGRLIGMNVILYGAGLAGRAFYKNIVEDAECCLIAWVDKNAVSIRNSTLLPVRDVSCIYELEYDYIIIAVFDKATYKIIRDEMVSNGIPEEKILWNPVKKL